MGKIIFFSSDLHDDVSVIRSREYLQAELQKYENSSAPGSVCFIATGGTEGKFLAALDTLEKPITLLSDGYHNSFAASMEIASYLESHGIEHTLVNYPMSDAGKQTAADKTSRSFNLRRNGRKFDNRLEDIYKMPKVAKYLSKSVVGLIGGPSDWLIASDIDFEAVSAKFGTRFVKVEISELITEFEKLRQTTPGYVSTRVNDAETMYSALKVIIRKYSLTALTVRCFDLIDPCRTTSCLALSRLNDEGIISGCEGDVPSLWTMMVVFAMTKHASFMANPSSSNPSENVVDFAHCTIPAKMTTSFTLPTHFESGMSVAIAGKLPVGDYRIVKIGGRNLDKMFTAKGKITHNTHIAARCRTQIRFQFADFEQYRNFADNRLGNHIIILPE